MKQTNICIFCKFIVKIHGGVPITDREIVESYIPIAKFIAAICGPSCEVAVHYLAEIDHSIIAIENGALTGRKVGDGLMDFDLHHIFDPDRLRQPYIANYTGKRSVNNRIFRFSTYYIHNDKGESIGLLNVNIDISNILSMQDTISRELLMGGASSVPSEMLAPQALVVSTDSLIDSTLDEAMKRYGFDDAQALDKAEKLKVISYLCDHNTFVLKGSVSTVAKKLGISEPTTYRYLQQLRADKAEA